MKRIKQLLSLSKEHHLSLTLAKQCKDMATRQNKAEMTTFGAILKKDFDAQWKNHFDIEEKTIFSLANNKAEAMQNLCKQLQEEHRTMAEMVMAIAKGNTDLLHNFGQLLHDHTRCEERILFPMVESQFSETELNYILEQSQ